MNSKEIYEAVKHIPEDSSFWPDNISTIVMLAEQLPKWANVFEIGTWYWRSASTWALATEWSVIALDICERTHTIAQKFIDDMWLSVKMVLWDSKDFDLVWDLVDLAWEEERFCLDDSMVDVVWIDWDHSYEGCMNDLKRFAPKARLLVCWHDYHSAWPDVIKAVDEYFEWKAKQDGNIWYFFK